MNIFSLIGPGFILVLMVIAALATLLAMYRSRGTRIWNECMAYDDRTKIKAAEYEVYLASRGATVRTPVTIPIQSVITAGGNSTWIPVGAYKQKTLKFKTSEYGVDIQGGITHQLGVKGEFEISALQSDATKLTAMEALKNNVCDILLVEIGTFVYKEYLGLAPVINIEDPSNQADPDLINIKGSAVAASVDALKNDGTLAVS